MNECDNCGGVGRCKVGCGGPSNGRQKTPAGPFVVAETPADDKITSVAPRTDWSIDGEWLVGPTGSCTCDGPFEVAGAPDHRDGCGIAPLVKLADLPGLLSTSLPDSETERPQRCPSHASESDLITMDRQCQQYEGHPHDHTWYGDNGKAFSQWARAEREANS